MMDGTVDLNHRPVKAVAAHIRNSLAAEASVRITKELVEALRTAPRPMNLDGYDELIRMFDGANHANILRLDSFAFFTLIQLFFFAFIGRATNQEKGIFLFMASRAVDVIAGCSNDYPLPQYDTESERFVTVSPPVYLLDVLDRLGTFLVHLAACSNDRVCVKITASQLIVCLLQSNPDASHRLSRLDKSFWHSLVSIVDSSASPELRLITADVMRQMISGGVIPGLFWPSQPKSRASARFPVTSTPDSEWLGSIIRHFEEQNATLFSRTLQRAGPYCLQAIKINDRLIEDPQSNIVATFTGSQLIFLLPAGSHPRLQVIYFALPHIRTTKTISSDSNERSNNDTTMFIETVKGSYVESDGSKILCSRMEIIFGDMENLKSFDKSLKNGTRDFGIAEKAEMDEELANLRQITADPIEMSIASGMATSANDGSADASNGLTQRPTSSQVASFESEQWTSERATTTEADEPRPSANTMPDAFPGWHQGVDEEGVEPITNASMFQCQGEMAAPQVRFPETNERGRSQNIARDISKSTLASSTESASVSIRDKTLEDLALKGLAGVDQLTRTKSLVDPHGTPSEDARAHIRRGPQKSQGLKAKATQSRAIEQNQMMAGQSVNRDIAQIQIPGDPIETQEHRQETKASADWDEAFRATDDEADVCAQANSISKASNSLPSKSDLATKSRNRTQKPLAQTRNSRKQPLAKESQSSSNKKTKTTSKVQQKSGEQARSTKATSYIKPNQSHKPLVDPRRPLTVSERPVASLESAGRAFSPRTQQNKPQPPILIEPSRSSIPKDSKQAFDNQPLASNLTPEVGIHPQAQDSQKHINNHRGLPIQLAPEASRSDDQKEGEVDDEIHNLIESYSQMPNSPRNRLRKPASNIPMTKQPQTEQDSNPIPEDQRKNLLNKASQSFGYKLTQSLLAQPTLIRSKCNNPVKDTRHMPEAERQLKTKSAHTTIQRNDKDLDSSLKVAANEHRASPKHNTKASNAATDMRRLDEAELFESPNRDDSEANPTLLQDHPTFPDDLSSQAAITISSRKSTSSQISPRLPKEPSKGPQRNTMASTPIIEDADRTDELAKGQSANFGNALSDSLMDMQARDDDNVTTDSRKDILTEHTSQIRREPLIEEELQPKSSTASDSPLDYAAEPVTDGVGSHQAGETPSLHTLQSNDQPSRLKMNQDFTTKPHTIPSSNQVIQKDLNAGNIVDKRTSAAMPPPSAASAARGSNVWHIAPPEQHRRNRVALASKEFVPSPNATKNAATNLLSKPDQAGPTFRTPIRQNKQRSEKTEHLTSRSIIDPAQEDVSILTDENLHRKTSLIRFGPDGPQNQGIPFSPTKVERATRPSKNFAEALLKEAQYHRKRKFDKDLISLGMDASSPSKKARLAKPIQDPNIHLESIDSDKGRDESVYVDASDRVTSSDELSAERSIPKHWPGTPRGRSLPQVTKVNQDGSPRLLPQLIEQPPSSPPVLSSKSLLRRLQLAQKMTSTQETHKPNASQPATPQDKTITLRLPPSPRHPKATFKTASFSDKDVTSSTPNCGDPLGQSSEPDTINVNQSNAGAIEKTANSCIFLEAGLQDNNVDTPSAQHQDRYDTSQKEQMIEHTEQIDISKTIRPSITASQAASPIQAEVVGTLEEPLKVSETHVKSCAQPAMSPSSVNMPSPKLIAEPGIFQIDARESPRHPGKARKSVVSAKAANQFTTEVKNRVDKTEVSRAPKVNDEQPKHILFRRPPKTPFKENCNKHPGTSLAQIIMKDAKPTTTATMEGRKGTSPKIPLKSPSVTADNEVTLVDGVGNNGDEVSDLRDTRVFPIPPSESSSSSSESSHRDLQTKQDIRARWREGLDGAEKSTSDMLHDLSDSLLFKLAEAGEGVIFKVRELERGGRWVLESFANAAARHMEGEGMDLEPRRREQVKAYNDAVIASEDAKKNLRKLRSIRELQDALQQKDKAVLDRLELLSKESN